MTETAYDTSKPTLLQKLSTRLQGMPPFKRTFTEGIVAGSIIIILLAAWMMLRSDRTIEKIQTSLPVEAVEITRAPTPEQIVQAEADALPKSADALPVAPIDGLFENKDGLTLPVARIQDDMTPFQAYKRPFTGVPGRPLLSIVIADFGLSATLSQTALQLLPSDITLIISPYAAQAMAWSNKARADGHEIWLGIPMQTVSGSDDTGPYTIAINSSLQENQNRLTQTLSSAVGYAGIVSHRSHAFTGDDIDMTPVLKQIYGRGLAFAESNPAYTFGQKLAAESGAPYARANVWIGDDLRPSAIDRALLEAELLATKQGSVVVFVQPFPVVLKKIALWSEEAQERGMQLAPLSALAR